MEPLQICIIILVVAGIWLVAELAITARRARRTMNEVDKTVAELNETLAETRPVVAKLDGTIDELQPAIAQVEPLLSSANVAVDALSANLVEVESVVRDVSAITGAAASAGNAVSNVADTASETARKLLGKLAPTPTASERVLEGAPEDAAEAPREEAPADHETSAKRYYTYEGTDEAPQADGSEESMNEGENA